ncbi:transmembrane transporter-like protein [Seiridium cupressi]
MATQLRRKFRLHSPWTQNFISGIGVGCSAGLYVALNLLGAGGGRPDSAQVVQVVNATLCSVWFLSSSFGGSILNKLGPGITMCIGVQTYAVYVGSLWYYDETGKRDYPYASGPIIGIGAGCVFITAGYIATAYPEESEKGAYATMLMNMQALGSVIGGIIPVIINRNSNTTAGVPRSVYIAFIVIMVIGGLMCLLLQRPHKLKRDDGSVVAVNPPRAAWKEFKDNLAVFKDPKLLLMLPAFFPSECFLVYSGAVNAHLNNLRVRSLLSFIAVVLQIPAGWGLQWILDHKVWGRRKRGLVGLTVVATPMIVAWVWEMIRVRNYDRSQPPTDPTDWIEPRFGWIFVLFMLTWVSSQLWHNIVYYWIGALTNNPRTLTHYVGVFRGVLGAGEALCFGLDSIQIPFIAEAGGVLLFYIIGISVFYYLGVYHMADTNYDKNEEGAVVPNHVLEEKGIVADGRTTNVNNEVSGSDSYQDKVV